MECSEIQKKLSAYIEGVISPEEKVLIEEHLKVCEKCSNALSELEKAIEYVQGLDEIEPPAWLSQKVMARVRSEAEPKRGILRRLFYPIHIKLPIEAVAAILIAVVSIYVFKAIQPEMKLAKAPSEEVASRTLAQEKEGAPVNAEDKLVAAKPAERFMLAEERETRARKTAGASKAPAKVAKLDKVEPPAGAVARDELKREAVSSELRAKTMVAGKGEGVHVRVDVKELMAATREIEEVLKQLEGNIISTESFKDRAVIVATLSSEKVEELWGKLNLIGEVKEEGKFLGAWEGDVEIRIELVERSMNP